MVVFSKISWLKRLTGYTEDTLTIIDKKKLPDWCHNLVTLLRRQYWRTNGQKWRNEQTKVHQFRKEPSYDDLSPCQVWIRLDKAFSSKSPEMKMLTHRQTDVQSYTNFKSHLAMMVIYLPVKFEFDWTKNFWVRVRKRKSWRTNRHKTDRITPILKAT